MSDIPRPDKKIPPVIEELFKLLPAPGTKWEEDKRAAFIAACEAIFDVVYEKSPQVR